MARCTGCHKPLPSALFLSLLFGWLLGAVLQFATAGAKRLAALGYYGRDLGTHLQVARDCVVERFICYLESPLLLPFDVFLGFLALSFLRLFVKHRNLCRTCAKRPAPAPAESAPAETVATPRRSTFATAAVLSTVARSPLLLLLVTALAVGFLLDHYLERTRFTVTPIAPGGGAYKADRRTGQVWLLRRDQLEVPLQAAAPDPGARIPGAVVSPTYAPTRPPLVAEPPKQAQASEPTTDDDIKFKPHELFQDLLPAAPRRTQR